MTSFVSSSASVGSTLWAPILDLLKGAAFSLGALVVVFAGIQMLAVHALGAQFDVQRWIDRIRIGRAARRILGSILLVVSGIAAQLHFAPHLLIHFEQAAPGVLVGIAAVLGGLALLTRNRGPGPRRAVLVLTVIVSVVLVGGCAIGNMIGQVPG